MGSGHSTHRAIAERVKQHPVLRHHLKAERPCCYICDLTRFKLVSGAIPPDEVDTTLRELCSERSMCVNRDHSIDGVPAWLAQRR